MKGGGIFREIIQRTISRVDRGFRSSCNFIRRRAEPSGRGRSLTRTPHVLDLTDSGLCPATVSTSDVLLEIVPQKQSVEFGQVHAEVHCVEINENPEQGSQGCLENPPQSSEICLDDLQSSETCLENLQISEIPLESPKISKIFVENPKISEIGLENPQSSEIFCQTAVCVPKMEEESTDESSLGSSYYQAVSSMDSMEIKTTRKTDEDKSENTSASSDVFVEAVASIENPNVSKGSNDSKLSSSVDSDILDLTPIEICDDGAPSHETSVVQVEASESDSEASAKYKHPSFLRILIPC